jgi:hypothetical protein
MPDSRKPQDQGDVTLDDWITDATMTAFMSLDDVLPPSRHWLGTPIPMLSEDGKAAVLNCTCGCFPCGGATARITIDAEIVTWSDFQQANSRTVIPLSPLRFTRSTYEAALRDLR